MIDIGIFLFFCVVVLAAIYSDIKSLTIPNWISLVLVIAFLVTRPLTSMPWSVVGLNFLCGSLFFAVGYGLFRVGLIGGGDVKLLAAVTVWIGFHSVFAFILLMSLIGAAVAVIWSLRTFLRHRGATLSERMRAMMKTELPYGIAIGLAAIATLSTEISGRGAL